MLANEEVFAVLLALVAVGSVFGAIQLIVPGDREPFMALGLLNEDCLIGSYPRRVVNSSYLDLCIMVYNHMGRPVYYRVVYKIGGVDDLPGNATPSRAPEIDAWRGVLGDDGNKTFRVSVAVYSRVVPSNATLIFELWVYDTNRGIWIYSGVWNHLHVQVVSG